MKTIFGGAAGQAGSATLTDQQRLMQAYKDNEEKIKSAITELKKQNIEDSVKRLVYPYLPKHLRKDSLLPRQLFLFLDEGNGGLPGYVFNSMLQTAQVLPYRSCIISAHETYHSIIGGVFGAKQESPYAVLYIHRLDSLLRTASHQYKTPSFDFSQFSKNGGHIPGRHIADSIRKAGLLPACIDGAGDPVSFVAYYKKAAPPDQHATISEESMTYLRQLWSRL